MSKRVFPICIFILCFFCVGFYVFEFLRATSNVSAENSPEKCEYTIVIDAGHGGADGGAVASDGISEKVINLEIAYKLNYILRAYGLNTVMTRTDDESIHDSNAKTLREQKVSDIHKRMSIMESDENNIFVSIHQNKFSNSSLWGTQVFYSPNTTDSAVLANCIQNSVCSLLQNDNKRVIKKSGSNIYLLYYAKRTAVLVECGFVSNPQENKLLEDSDYQRKMAFSIAYGIMEYINTKDV